ncbi:MAG: 2-oxoglutarate dehydrogenase, partial [Betaproteobacteria bacterium]
MTGIRSRDPLAALGRQLADATRHRIEARNASFIDEIRAQAEASPEARYSDVPEHIFGATVLADVRVSYPRPVPNQNVRQAINAALRHLLATIPEALLLGEDLHDP